MKMRYVLVFVAAISLGGLMGWMGPTISTVNPKERISTASAPGGGIMVTSRKNRIEKLEENNYSLSLRIAELEGLLEDYERIKREEEEALFAAKEELIETRLKEYSALFELSSDQAHLIGEWEWEQRKFWSDFHSGKRSADDPVPNVEDKVREILSPDQLEIYEAHLDEKHHRDVELAAQGQLTFYPTTLNLSGEQKDELFLNLYDIQHKSTNADHEDGLKSYRDIGHYTPGAEYLLLAARGVLSEDQFEELEKSLRRSQP